MAISKVAHFNWERAISMVGGGEGLKPLMQLRGKANEIASNHAKFGVQPQPIDFQGYKKKLKFVGGSIASLEKMYASRKLPKYSATLPDFEAKKRAAVIAAYQAVSVAAEKEVANLNIALDQFDTNRFNDESDYETAAARFPHLAKQIDEELNDHDWLNEKKWN